MKNKCNTCKIFVDSGHTKCPICKAIVSGNDGISTIYSYNKVSNNLTQTNFKYYNTFRCLIIAIAILVVLLQWMDKFQCNQAHNINLIWDILTVVAIWVCTGFMKCICKQNFIKLLTGATILVLLIILYIDMLDGALTWGMIYVLPTLIAMCCLFYIGYMNFSSHKSTSTVFWCILCLMSGLVIHIFSILHIFVFSACENQILNTIYLCIDCTILTYLLLFKYKEIKTSIHAQIHL